MASLTEVAFTFTGRKTWKFTYSDGTNTYTDVKSTTETYKPTMPTEVGTYTYTISALKDRKCTASSTAGSATITIKPIPSAEITPTSSEVCEGEEVVLTATSDQSGATFAWGGKGSGTGASKTLTEVSESGTYKVTATLNDERASGLALGLAAHAIGTAQAWQRGSIAGRYAAFGMAVNAVFTAIWLPTFILFLQGT